MFQLSLSPFMINSILVRLLQVRFKLNMANSTFTQAVGIKHGVVSQINDCPVMIDLVIVDMHEDPIAPIISR